MQCLVHKCDPYAKEMLAECKLLKNKLVSSVSMVCFSHIYLSFFLSFSGAILLSILNSFRGEFIAANALEFLELINNCDTPGITKSQLLRPLGSCVSSCAPLQEQRVQFLNAAFQTINTLTDPNEYINCVETWTPFVAQYFTVSAKYFNKVVRCKNLLSDTRSESFTG